MVAPSTPRPRLGPRDKEAHRGTVLLPAPTGSAKFKKNRFGIGLKVQGAARTPETGEARPQSPEKPKAGASPAGPQGGRGWTLDERLEPGRGRQISPKGFEETSLGWMDELEFGPSRQPGPEGRASEMRGCRGGRPPALPRLPGARQVGGTCTRRDDSRKRPRTKARVEELLSPSEPPTQKQTTDSGAS